jgi:phosphoglycolate phosphatase-like HAD superfamily hydrolase
VCYATGSLLKTAQYKLDQIGISYTEKQLIASNHLFEREHIVSTAIESARNFYGVPSFHKIISVGDGLWDLKTANNLNLSFIGIGDLNRNVLLQNGAKIILSDFSEMDLKMLES